MIMAALSLTAVMGMSGLAVEVGNGYATKIRNQRVADMAALGAAQAYQSNQSVTAATQVANDIVAASGVTSGVTVTTGPVNGVSAIQVTVTNSVPISLAKGLMNSASYNVTSYAAASLASTSTPGCITALSSSVTYGVSLTGGTHITATGCAVLTNSGVSATSGTTISAQQVVAGKTINDVAAQWGTPGITTTPTANNIKSNKSGAASDTVGTDARIVAGFAKVGNYTAPTAPGSGAQAWNFNYSPTGQIAPWWNSSTKTYTIPAANYDVTSISMGGGIKVVVQNGAVIRVSGNVSVTGTSITMGAATLDIGGQLNIAGGSTMTVASGNVAIGSNASGNAITVGNGAVLSFGDGLFSANGSIVTGGGSSITFGATSSHYINGALTLSGSATFGAGAYYIDGDFTNGTGGILSGTGVTFFASGTLNMGGGATLNLVAPSTDAGGGVTDLLFATKSTAATNFDEGATGYYAGMVYAPNSNLTMSGGASAGNTGRCLSFIVNTFTLSGGTTAGTACTSLGGGSSGSSGVSLLQ